MRGRTFLILALCCLALPAGCTGVRSRVKDRAEERQIDELWQQGYGFNNPNPERIRQGLDPVNFDGRTDKERQSDILGEIVGHTLGYLVVGGLKWTFSALGSLFRR